MSKFLVLVEVEVKAPSANDAVMAVLYSCSHAPENKDGVRYIKAQHIDHKEVQDDR